jgi:hypothetical protein
MDWMDDGTNGWMEKASRKTTTTSFTICNAQRKEFCRNVTNNALLFCQLILMVCHFSTIQQAGGPPRTLHLNFTAGGPCSS